MSSDVQSPNTGILQNAKWTIPKRLPRKGNYVMQILQFHGRGEETFPGWLCRALGDRVSIAEEGSQDREWRKLLKKVFFL